MFLTSPTLSSLRYFDVAARALSFKQAASELCVTHGAVSQQIKHLEEALGCKLFYRLPRQVALTPEGRRFASVVRRALGEIESEARAIALSRLRSDIRLRVGTSFALRWLVPRMSEFYARHPDIKLFINAEYGYIDPAHRQFDLAIDLSNGEYTSLQSEFLMPEYVFPICTPAYLAQHGPLTSPDDLNRCALLHDAHSGIGEQQDAEWKYWLKAVGAESVDGSKGLFFSLSDMAMEAALNHQGVALGRAALIGDRLELGQLVAPFGERIESAVGYYLAYPKEMADHPQIKTVISWLHEQASEA